jgi:hypothetical protein
VADDRAVVGSGVLVLIRAGAGRGLVGGRRAAAKVVRPALTWEDAVELAHSVIIGRCT